MTLDEQLHGVSAYQPTFSDHNWTNPGRSPEEKAFFDRKKAEHDLKHGCIPPLPSTSIALPQTDPPDMAKERKRGARMSGRKRQAPVFGDAPEAFVPKHMRRKIIYAAECFERKTKLKGRKNGLLGATGVNLLRVLLFTFLSAKGKTYPSYNAMMEATGYCKQTIAECIDRLERHGFLKVINRVRRIKDQVFSPLHGRPIEIIRVVQTSNAYTIHLPESLKEDEAEPTAHRPFPFRRIVEETAAIMSWKTIQTMLPNLGLSSESGS